ncbi:Zinc finger and BTB domain-containing protein 40 [Portunus trituberculatus]|uniref:Zinc finger and BTB domain-containing protein 40 n=1 Tax=Portunus trituberculatus TaxID=210409 RepID=A0A5B7D113_PORTR|nr:Zinc finger and BTB domain-containing protein 40 [Portunus trituberculatus]
MPGGRRKSRKPQKWEDFVADEEQLASLEKELEQEEEARKLSVEEMDGGDDSDGEAALKIVVEEEENIVKEEEEDPQEEELLEQVEETVDGKDAAKVENGEGEAVKGEKEETATPSIIGDCITCGIQLRDWPATHSHLRFHRLSHVPDCISKNNAHTKRINCQVCQRSCQTQEVLAYHAYTEHYVKLRQAKTCPFCCTTFSCLDEFLDHLDITNISFNFYSHCMDVIHGDRPNKRVVEPCPPKQQTRFRPFLCEMCDRRFVVYSEYKRHIHSHSKSRAYVCTHCGRSYCQKNTLIVHLYSYHNASANAEEVMPREDTSQRRCEACGRIGFANEELLVRHCVMRCPRRNNLQASFAVIIASIAKNQNTSFAETLRSPTMVTYLKLGLEAWQTPAFVRDYLGALQAAASSPSMNLSTTLDLTTSTASTTTTTTTTRKDSVEFTDIQLLAYLTQFEEKNREEREQMMQNLKTKSDSKWEEGKTLPPDDMEEEMEEGGGEESLLPFLCTTTSTPSSPPTTSCSPPLPYPTAAPQINHASLMQHLRRGSERRSTSEHAQGGGQGEAANSVDICLVTSTTNTQVTITPAGHHLTQDIRPPKETITPSEEAQPTYTQTVEGIRTCALGNPSDPKAHMVPLHERAMEAAGFTQQDMQRLEVEAQLLREAEPFYFEEYPSKGNKEDKNCLAAPPSPITLQRLTAEIDDMYEGGRKENDIISSPLSPDSTQNKMREENSLDSNASQAHTDSPSHSPHRKRAKVETETDSRTPPPKKWGGGGSGSGGSAFSSAGQESVPPKQLIDRLLREAQALAEG